jgi:hypothetical protein
MMTNSFVLHNTGSAVWWHEQDQQMQTIRHCVCVIRICEVEIVNIVHTLTLSHVDYGASRGASQGSDCVNAVQKEFSDEPPQKASHV